MNKILHIMASPGGADSHSFILSNTLINQLPAADVRQRDLNQDPPPLVSKAYIRAIYTDPGQRTAEQQALLRYSDSIIAEVREADIIVIGTPVHNFGIPALLKAWIDQLVRPGVTSGKGGSPFVHKKVYVAVASGRMSNPDFIKPYLKAILAEVGLTDVTVLTLNGTAQRTIRQEDYEQLIANV
jgi:FMN-dependent NADH-azoreductase